MPYDEKRSGFYADYAKPEGFCDEAWKAIYQYVFSLAHSSGKELFYYGDWIRKPGVAICSCNDGLDLLFLSLNQQKKTPKSIILRFVNFIYIELKGI